MVDIANFRFTSPADSFGQGFETGNALRQNSAKLSAGRAMQGGDITGAANALYGGGMIGAGTEVANYGQAQQDRVTKQADARRDELLKFTTDAAGRLAEYHHSTGDVNKTLSAFDQMAAQFSQYGETPEEIAQVRQQLASDPDGTLVALGAGAAKQLGYDVQGSGDEVLVIDKKTGKLVSRYRGARTTTLGEAASLVEIPGSYGQAGSPAAPPLVTGFNPDAPGGNISGAIDANGHPPAAAPVGSGAPRSTRNNNPGNIEDGPFAQSLPGYKGSDGRFAIFDSAAAGATAQTRLLQSYGRRGFNSVKAIIERWAPKEDGNDTQAYIDFVARTVGASPREVLNLDDPAVAQRVAAAITQFEGGEAPQAPAQPYQVASAGDTPPPPEGGAHVLLTRPKAAKQQEPPSGYRWAADGQLAFIPGGPADPAAQATNTAKNTRKAAADLRKEFNQRPEVKEYRDVTTSYRQISELVSKPPTAAGDLSLIFSYMKMLDPGSVVREGEFATAQNAAGVPDQVVNAYNRVRSGQRLNPKQRTDFLNQARSIHDTRQRRYGEIVGEYRGYAEDYGVDPDQVSVVPTQGEMGKAKPAGWSGNLPPAQVQAAMRFKGSTAPAGSAENPSLPTDEAEYKALPRGAHYIHPSGAVKVKP